MVRTMGRRRRGDRARGAGGKDVCVLDVGRDGTRRSPATPPPRERWGGVNNGGTEGDTNDVQKRYLITLHPTCRPRALGP